ncbi:flagellin [Salicibibacter halophilus]|uniref:Flagellin n=1 Tax=Salicibibacter halophilus TaxID=2502791 RepID=A0A514LKR8_9BACI|nr:flagellin [Salicibibacter halophilus]QDI92460.1 flagellin [Salicibibacter halophilus]
MIINNNLSAMNAHRQLGVNQNNMQDSMEKLSSGEQINRAGDDAAGLAISEKMRAQIRGLDQASNNAQDGISLIQTAEGALDETHQILQRMRELATQSANDTNQDDVDRDAIQEEVDALATEIDRISGNTEFNSQSLLDGSFEGKFHIGANSGQNMDVSIDQMDATSLGVAGGGEFLTEGSADVEGLGEQTVLQDGDDNVVAVQADNENWYAVDDVELDNSDNVVPVEGATALEPTEVDQIDGEVVTSEQTDYEGVETTVYSNNAGDVVGVEATTGEDSGEIFAPDDVSVEDDEISGGGEQLTLEDGYSLGSNGDGIDVSTQSAADGAIDTINTAINYVSTQRSELGAVQNRLEHTIANLDNASENLQAAESRIRDTDLAQEMMEFTQSNILSQASQSMLAQANQLPQNVLQLLQ